MNGILTIINHTKKFICAVAIIKSKMSIIKDICRIHLSKTGQKRITFPRGFSDKLDLPLKTKLFVEYDTETKILTVKDL
jgi:hypothetical protein